MDRENVISELSNTVIHGTESSILLCRVFDFFHDAVAVIHSFKERAFIAKISCIHSFSQWLWSKQLLTGAIY